MMRKTWEKIANVSWYNVIVVNFRVICFLNDHFFCISKSFSASSWNFLVSKKKYKSSSQEEQSLLLVIGWWFDSILLFPQGLITALIKGVLLRCVLISNSWLPGIVRYSLVILFCQVKYPGFYYFLWGDLWSYRKKLLKFWTNF